LLRDEKLSAITSMSAVKADIHRVVIELENVKSTILQNDDISLDQNEIFEILKNFLDG
ncbi:hypothetical protein NTPn13_10920, partial [Streptococcus pneumoniae]